MSLLSYCGVGGWWWRETEVRGGVGSQANAKGYRPHFTSNIKDTGNYHMQLRGSDTGVGYLFYLTLQSLPSEMLGEERKNDAR